MDYRQNARLSFNSRDQLDRRVLEQGLILKLAAANFKVTQKTAAKWVRRYQAGLVMVCGTAVHERTTAHAPPPPPYWKRFLPFAGCATTLDHRPDACPRPATVSRILRRNRPHASLNYNTPVSR